MITNYDIRQLQEILVMRRLVVYLLVLKYLGRLIQDRKGDGSIKCATCEDIHSCLDAVPNPGWRSFSVFNNCRRFVRWALPGCCLDKK